MTMNTLHQTGRIDDSLALQPGADVIRHYLELEPCPGSRFAANLAEQLNATRLVGTKPSAESYVTGYPAVDAWLQRTLQTKQTSLPDNGVCDDSLYLEDDNPELTRDDLVAAQYQINIGAQDEAQAQEQLQAELAILEQQRAFEEEQEREYLKAEAADASSLAWVEAIERTEAIGALKHTETSRGEGMRQELADTEDKIAALRKALAEAEAHRARLEQELQDSAQRVESLGSLEKDAARQVDALGVTPERVQDQTAVEIEYCVKLAAEREIQESISKSGLDWSGF